MLTEECWLRLATGSLARPEMAGGYTDRLTDVEHSAEETGDPLTSILLIGKALRLLPLSVGCGQAPSYVHNLDLTRAPGLNVPDKI